MIRYAVWIKDQAAGAIRVGLLDAESLTQALAEAGVKVAKFRALNPTRSLSEPWLVAKYGGVWLLDGTEPEECEDNACMGCAWCGHRP